MGFDERLGWLLFGCAIGFVLGYIVRSLRDIKEELDDVEKLVKQQKNEDGFVRYPLVMDIALLCVVVLTVWAAFASQRASNDVQSTQNDLARTTVCTQQYLSKTIRALNERTTYSQQAVAANVELQRAQAEMLSVLLREPPVGDPDREKAVQSYFRALTDFVSLSGRSGQKADTYPYPTNEELAECLNPRNSKSS